MLQIRSSLAGEQESCSKTMNVEQNRLTAIAFLQRMGTGVIDRALITEDLTWWVQGRGTYPIDEFEGMLTNLAALLEGPGEQRVIATTAEGDRVAVESEAHSVFKGGLLYENTYHFLLTFRGNLICSVKEYYNSAYTRDFRAKLQSTAASPPWPALADQSGS